MSRIPYLSDELFPWPRIHLGELSSNATAVDQRTTSPRLRRGSSQQPGDNVSSTKSRGRASSDVGPLTAKSQIRDRSTSFGSTQEYEGVYGSAPVQRLDPKVSDRKVQELLKLRKHKLKDVERKGDRVEVLRLKNLNLFDDIEKLETKKKEPKETKSCRNLTRQTCHRGFISQNNALDSSFTSRPRSVNQGHTATLCWHLKLEFTQGLTVPEEFSLCNIHPTPSPCASSSSSSTLPPTSPSSLGPRSRLSLRHTKVSAIGSSTLSNSLEPPSIAASSSTAIASEPSPSIAPNHEEKDPFLYIAKYIRRHAKRDWESKEAKRSGPQASSANARRSLHIHCTCTNHNCRALSGAPSKHCRFCTLPRLQPEIAAAVDRIEAMKTSVLAQAGTTLPAEELSEADEFRKFEALQEDMKLVEMYNAETEKRCRNGVWWEGWLIVEGLKRQGIVGSKLFVYERDTSVA